MEKKKIKVHDVKPIRNNRRRFLKLSGAAALGTGLFLMGCSDDDDDVGYTVPPKAFDLGTGDLGVLNYAYALEQLEADFYTKVVNDSNFTSTFNDNEQTILTDLYNHEVIHRDFFNTAINAAVGNNTDLVLPTLEFDYGGLDFSNKQQVLTTSRDLEDTGVAAYNGAGKLIKDAGYLLVAGKIVSVEARHASAIRNLLNPGSADFAGNDVVSTDNGLGRALDPVDIVDIAGQFITTPFTYMEQGIG